jgi:D-galactarolactone cycloisomerase
MKIKHITSYILKAPIDHQTFWSSQCSFNTRKSLLVKIETDNGLTGWGEGGQYGPAEPVQSMVHDVLSPLILGKEPIYQSMHWEQMYTSIRDFARKGAGIEAISALDMALWDIKGKAFDQPVSVLLGGQVRNEIQCYATGLYYRGRSIPDPEKDLENLQEEARYYIENGFKAVKMKVGLFDPKLDLVRVQRVREIIGRNNLLMVDANHAYGRANAKYMAKGLAESDVYWFEEPVVPEDIDGYRELCNLGIIPVAGGECEYTRYGFARWFSSGALDICQPDISCTGGITEAKRIADMAQAFHVQCIPHVWGSGVAIAAGLQLLASMPTTPHTANPSIGVNEPFLEWDCNPNPLRTELLTEPFEPLGGKIIIPQKPGLGIEIKKNGLADYLITERNSL